MIDPPAGRIAVARLVVALVVACAAAGCTTTPAGSAAATASPGPTNLVSVVPSTRTPIASPSPSSVPPSVAPSDSEAPLEPPPAATLVAGEARHTGEAGSWAWAGGTSDSPWLPARALDRADLPAGDVTVVIDEGVEVESWTAVAAAADDTEGINVEPLGDGSGAPTFRLSSGDWVLAVDVRFTEGRGSARYYWHVVVT